MRETHDAAKIGQRRWRAEIWVDDGEDFYHEQLDATEVRTKRLAEDYARAKVAEHRKMRSPTYRIWAHLEGGEYCPDQFDDPTYGAILDAQFEPFEEGTGQWDNGRVVLDWWEAA